MDEACGFVMCRDDQGAPIREQELVDGPWHGDQLVVELGRSHRVSDTLNSLEHELAAPLLLNLASVLPSYAGTELLVDCDGIDITSYHEISLKIIFYRYFCLFDSV